MIISVLQHESDVVSPVLSAGFAVFTHEKAEYRRFSPVLPNESDSKTVSRNEKADG